MSSSTPADTLAEPEWACRLGDADRRGLTPLFTVDMTPYGEIQLNLDRRLDLATGSGPAQTCTRCAVPSPTPAKERYGAGTTNSSPSRCGA
jgi:hypothetical protein